LAYNLAASGDVQQIGYGGQAGGGKTDLILGLAGTVFPESKIFRRTFTHLKKIMQRGNDIYPVRYVSGKQITGWRWDKHIVELAHMQYEKNWEDHQGQPAPLIAFDEAAQFSEMMVRTVGGWLRTTDENQHTLLLLCFNPPTTPEGEWIVQFFAPWIDPEYPGEPAAPGEIRWFVNVDSKDVEVANGDPVDIDGQILYPVSRTFIPASRHDNPYLGIEYERALSAMPEPLRTMMMKGDFTVGGQDDPWQVIPTNWILQAMERGRNTPKPDVNLRAVGVDVAHGGKDCTAIARLYGNWFAPLIIYAGHETPDGQTAAHYVIQSMEGQQASIFVDGIGYGASCADALISMTIASPNTFTMAVNFGAGSTLTDQSGIYRFKNVRAECFWRLREALDPASGEDICLPDDRDLRVELAAMRYKIVAGKIQIEEKAEIIKRLGHSPDKADAIALAWSGASMPRTASITYLD
jgi:hypothetical protein